MGNVFDKGQMQRARYYYEKLVYTGWPFAGGGGTSSLNTGLTPVFSASSWNIRNNPTWRATLESIQATQIPGVLAQATADPSNQINTISQGDLGAAWTGLHTIPYNLKAVDTLSLNLQNTTGKAISHFQFNYTVSAKRLTAIEKLLAKRSGLTSSSGWYELLPEEIQALKSLDLMSASGHVDRSGLEQIQALIDKGTSPIGIERIIQGIYKNRELAGPSDFFSVVASTTDEPFATYSAMMDSNDPTRGRFLVLTELGIEPSLASANNNTGANITISVDRDGQPGYLTINGAAFLKTDSTPRAALINTAASATQSLPEYAIEVLNVVGLAGGATSIAADTYTVVSTTPAAGQVQFTGSEGNPSNTLTFSSALTAGGLLLVSYIPVVNNLEPISLWIPALDHLTFHVVQGPGSTSSVAAGVRIRVATVEMSEVIAVQFGLAHHASDVAGNTYNKVLVGVI